MIEQQLTAQQVAIVKHKAKRFAEYGTRRLVVWWCFHADGTMSHVEESDMQALTSAGLFEEKRGDYFITDLGLKAAQELS